MGPQDDYQIQNVPSWAAQQALEVALTPQPLTEREAEVRRQFAVEYVKDHNATAAAIRCGFNPAFAQEYATRFLGEAFVRQYIQWLETKQDDLPEDELRKHRQKRIEQALLRDMDSFESSGSHSARVSAAGKLMSLWGLEAAKKVDANVNHTGSVMVVPGIAKLEDWEAEALQSQGRLIDAVQADVNRE